MLTGPFSNTLDALDVFNDYNIVKNAPDNGKRLPMSNGQPDFAWADEESGILAVKRIQKDFG